MELINRQDAIKALRDTFLGDTYEIDVVACGMIECLKTVEAIPVDWIEKWLERYSYRNYRREIIEFMVTEWKHEQEKQNESD